MIGSGEAIYKNSRISAAKEDRLQILDKYMSPDKCPLVLFFILNALKRIPSFYLNNTKRHH